MRTTYEQQLGELTERLGELASVAERALQLASTALFDEDLAAAEQALDLQENIAAAEAECRDRTVVFLALQSPVAGDLRHVFAAVRIAENLARMGELALHIAEAVRRRSPQKLVPDTVDELVRAMATFAATIAALVTDAVTTPTLEAITRVRATDADLDAAHARLLAALEAPDWTHGVRAAIDLALIARFYERFGDQGVDVADRLYFFVTGRRPTTAN
ncbi:phosphate uptake regulator PhoU [Rhodococcus sp. NPDC003318]|uniref:phosphate signaling complex PhoU family protein n=1 Tax=Rhodococcus sp. NPDC003318 TaxID=3364503 RepID=UPI0036B4175E